MSKRSASSGLEINLQVCPEVYNCTASRLRNMHHLHPCLLHHQGAVVRDALQPLLQPLNLLQQGCKVGAGASPQQRLPEPAETAVPEAVLPFRPADGRSVGITTVLPEQTATQRQNGHDSFMKSVLRHNLKLQACLL